MSWEDLLVQLGKVEPMAWNTPKPAPAPGGLLTHPQAAEPSGRVRGMGWEGLMSHHSPLGELRGPAGPADGGWLEGGRLVLPLGAAD